MRRGFELVAGAVVVCAGITAAPDRADAFCGFYVSGADATLYNNATQVVLMREGTRTVLSMQNNYQGPPQDFAMVVPVPVVLQEENVKTLPKEIFSRVDQLSAPRLVEYWEQDPCQQLRYETEEKAMAAPSASAGMPREKAKDLGVTVEAQFEVGEYQIVILSAKDSTGLETWLNQEKYKIPAGAEPYLKPYVEQGSKFFVAKVDVEKVTFKDGQAMLSPLRFHYDSNKFDLPIRLGLMNSAGTQDLIVHILAPGKRYQTSNYDNVTIPTNIDVRNEARQRFGEFYAALFDRTLAKNPKAVVTEYAWDASSCDPCPTPALEMNELATLGMDVLYTPMSAKPKPKPKQDGSITSEKKGDAVDDLVAPKRERPPVPSQPMRMPNQGFVLTRLHARYDKTNLGEDLVFEQAEPIMGGREVRNGPNGTLEEGSQKAGMNNFQARYAIRHEWEGPIACANPQRGVWGGPPAGQEYKIQAAQDLAFVARGKTQLAMMVKQDVPEIDVKAGEAPPPEPTAEPAQPDKPAAEPDKPPATPTGADDGKDKKGGCGCSTSSAGGAWAVLACAAAIAAAVRRRRTGATR